MKATYNELLESHREKSARYQLMNDVNSREALLLFTEIRRIQGELLEYEKNVRISDARCLYAITNQL